MRFLTIFLLLFLSANISAQELPPANFENSFYIMPLDDARFAGLSTFEAKEAEVLKMKHELGVGNLYHRLGISFIYIPEWDAQYRDAFKLAEKHGMHMGMIFAIQSHTRADFRKIADSDFRQYQWRLDGVDWKGAYTSSGELEVPEDERDYKIPTPSRLATHLREYNHGVAEKWAIGVLKLMEEFPGVITCINGPIEEELAIGGHSNTAKLGDYSPFAITEFRDWLRHSGIYDSSSGEYAGEGAISLIIGDLIDFNGTLRSQFYDDPNPKTSNGTGVSFNEFFGTEFATWSLKYWDLTMYPNPIVNENFECTPEFRQGFCEGGFDAPRILNPGYNFWNAWSYDIPDHLGKYPDGNPDTPAFGFRQTMVRNFVRDLFDVLEAEGLPTEIMYAHQIPGEGLDNFTGEAGRNRSSASTVWTGYLEKNQTVGITRFGDIDPVLMTQYADDWGIFEWHTRPFSFPGEQILYDVSINALNRYYSNGCHILFPGWWSYSPPVPGAIFPLNDSKFSEAIGDFMVDRDEMPYHQQGSVTDYAPAQVVGVSGFLSDLGELEIQWNSNIWDGLLAKWDDWSQFDYFEVQWSTDGVDWSNSDTTSMFSYLTTVSESSYKVRVRAISTVEKIGAWSEIINSKMETGADLSLELIPEFLSLYFDPEISNPINITEEKDQYINPDSLQVSISGDGSIQNTVPIGLDSIENFWPMNFESEIFSVLNMDDMQFEGGVMSANISPVEPIDPYFYFAESSINGESLPYITFRLYSSVNTTGGLYWFIDGGHRSTSFIMEEGWHVYQLNNIAEWISLQQINMVRLDPGTTGSARIKLDWFAISSQPISTEVKGAVQIHQQEIILLTNPAGNPGSYTVTVEYKGVSESTTIQTSSINQKPTVHFQLPSEDTLIEKGYPIQLQLVVADVDGEVRGTRFFSNDILIDEVTSSPFTFQWIPDESGVYQVKAEVYDNAYDTVSSLLVLVEVQEQVTLSGTPHQIPGSIEAEDYDMGGEIIAYWDTDITNQGNAYREDGVDIGLIADGGYYLGWTEKGEWLEYTVDVDYGGKVEIIMTLASEAGGGEFHFEINDKPISNHQFVGSTGSDQEYQEFSIEDLYVPEGTHKLKLFIDIGGFNIDKFEISEYEVFLVGLDFPGMELIVYPNPVKDEISFTIPIEHNSNLKIFSISGKLMKNINLYPETEQRISISDLPAGIYIVNIISDDKIWMGKIVKD